MLNYPVAGIFVCSEDTNEGTHGFSNQISKTSLKNADCFRNHVYRVKTRSQANLYGLPIFMNPAAGPQEIKSTETAQAVEAADDWLDYREQMLSKHYLPLTVSESISLGRGVQQILREQKAETRVASEKAGKQLKRRSLALDGTDQLQRITERLVAGVYPVIQVKGLKYANRFQGGWLEADAAFNAEALKAVEEWDPEAVISWGEYISAKLEIRANVLIDEGNNIQVLDGQAVANHAFRQLEAKGQFKINTEEVMMVVEEYYESISKALPKYWKAIPEKVRKARAKADMTEKEAAQAAKVVMKPAKADTTEPTSKKPEAETGIATWPYIERLYQAYAMSRKISINAPMDEAEGTSTFADVLEFEGRDPSVTLSHAALDFYEEMRSTEAFTASTKDPSRTTQRLWTLLFNKKLETSDEFLVDLIKAYESANADEELLMSMNTRPASAREAQAIPAMFGGWCNFVGIDPRDGTKLALGGIKVRNMMIRSYED